MLGRLSSEPVFVRSFRFTYLCKSKTTTLPEREVSTPKTFEELGVSEPIRRAIEQMGYRRPMPVQEQVIPYLLGDHNDVVALAQTGTGKTAAYGLPLLQSIAGQSEEGPIVQALIICPTRELCVQITSDLKSYARYLDGIRILAVYGGANIETQIRQLKKGVHIIVATPGRLVDLMERGVAKLESVENVVLDEADEMLSMGFSESIDTILERVPRDRNTLLFSATMSAEIERISKSYLHDAKEIVIGSRNEGAELVNHIYYLVQARDKYNALKRVADYYPEIYAIVFCRTRLETQEIADKLIQDGYNADALHGELSQAMRDLVMNKFRQHHVQLLVATDVAARGLDVPDLTHVINYGLPDDLEVYTHRSGRTGRAGKEGTSICIIHVKERSKVRAIEKQIGKQFMAAKLPTGEEICRKQLLKVIDDVEKVDVDEEMIAPFLPEVYRKLDMMERDDIIKRMVSREFNTFLNYYKNAPEIIQPNERGKKEERPATLKRAPIKGGRAWGPASTAEEGYTRLFINVGKLDHLHVREFMGLLNRLTRGQQFTIGRIDLMKSFSFFEVPTEQADDLIRMLQGQNLGGRTINVEKTEKRPAGKRQYTEENQYKPHVNKRGRDKYADRQYKNSKRTEETDENERQSAGRPEWARFFEGQVEDQPFYSVFAKKKRNRKKT